ARVLALVAPVAARAVGVDVAATRRLAEAVDAARARLAQGGAVRRRAWAVLVGEAARVRGRVADAALAYQRCRSGVACAVEDWARVRRIAGHGGAVGEQRRASVRALVAPLAGKAAGDIASGEDVGRAGSRGGEDADDRGDAAHR